MILLGVGPCNGLACHHFVPNIFMDFHAGSAQPDRAEAAMSSPITTAEQIRKKKRTTAIPRDTGNMELSLHLGRSSHIFWLMKDTSNWVFYASLNLHKTLPVS